MHVLGYSGTDTDHIIQLPGDDFAACRHRFPGDVIQALPKIPPQLILTFLVHN